MSAADETAKSEFALNGKQKGNVSPITSSRFVWSSLKHLLEGEEEKEEGGGFFFFFLAYSGSAGRAYFCSFVRGSWQLRSNVNRIRTSIASEADEPFNPAEAFAELFFFVFCFSVVAAAALVLERKWPAKVLFSSEEMSDWSEWLTRSNAQAKAWCESSVLRFFPPEEKPHSIRRLRNHFLSPLFFFHYWSILYHQASEYGLETRAESVCSMRLHLLIRIRQWQWKSYH